ncbi:MAG: RNA methyltransferase [Proteobacteria bacterium]|nr:RNA methyltransferase [Pseudomonadota bacterium]
MDAVEVRDPDDPRIADFRGVRDPEWLKRRRLFVAEGRQVIEIALAEPRLGPPDLLLTRVALAALEPALRQRRGDLRVFVATPELMRAVGGYRFHQGALGVFPVPGKLELQALLAAGAAGRPLIAALEAVTNPDNVGSAFRNARAFGASGVLLDPRCAHPLYRKSLRTSMGAALRVPFVRAADWPAALERLASEGLVRVALSPDPGGSDLDAAVEALASAAGLVLVLGHERDGLARETLANCEWSVRIPMAEGVDSVNVATASGIALSRFAGL